MVRRVGLTVVRGEAVDDVQVLPESLHVLAGPQHGPHLRSAVADLCHVVLAEEEVMRCHLTRDLDALLLRRSDDQDLKKEFMKPFSIRNLNYPPFPFGSVLHLLLLGHVADVNRPPVELRHHEDRGDRLLLGVSDDGELLGPLLEVLHTEPDSSAERCRKPALCIR